MKAIYLKPTLDKLVKRYIHSENDQKLYEFSFSLWNEIHKSQVRDSWEEYFTHPIQSVFILIDLFGSEISLIDIIICLLHDSLEDTIITYDVLDLFFGCKISDCIRQLTKKNKLDYLTHQDKKRIDNLSTSNDQDKIEIDEILHQARLRRDHEYYWKLCEWPIEALRVKICDRLHNLMTLPLDNKRKIEKNLRTTKMYFIPCSEKFSPQIIKKINEILKTLES